MSGEIALRPYQISSQTAVQQEWANGRLRTLLVLPTGCGKTIVFSKIAEECVRRGERVLILAHRAELLEQAADKIFKSTGLICATEKAEQTSLDSWYRIVVGSVQTLMRTKRLNNFDADFFNTIIIDEAHHALSDSYQRILEYFSSSKVLGVTATPDRGDMKNLGIVFESLAFEYTLPQAIKDGFLSPIKAMTIPIKLDLSNISITTGDFNASDLSNMLDPYLEEIANEMVKICMNRKTVVFLPLVATSKKFKDILDNKGFSAAEVNGNSVDRKEIIADFESDKYNVLCNSMLLTEGWDCPTVDCVIVLRPTKSRSLYSQMVGRGTRLAPNKDHLLLLDFLWHTSRHELCMPADLICTDREVSKVMTAKIQEAAVPMDIEQAQEQASEDVILQREESLANKLAEQKNKKKQLVDPLQYVMSIQDENLSSYVPSFGWEALPPTENQIKEIEKNGVSADGIENAGLAQEILNKLNIRKTERLSTAKQIRLLEKPCYGFSHVGEWTFDSAQKMISRISAQGWRGVPKGVDPKTYKPTKEQ